MCAATLMVMGCSKDDGAVKPVDNSLEQKKEIALKTNLTDMLTRANTIDSNNELHGEDIMIDAYFNGTETKYLDGQKLHYDTDAWVFWDGSAQLHYYWPIEGSVYDPDADPVSSLDFVGYCPYTKPSYIGTPTYDHTTGVSFTGDLSDYMNLASQASLQEYLVAVLDEQTLADQETHGGVPLEFKHPFALIKFVITPASGTHVQINSISIAGLKTGGTCTYDGADITWDDYSGSATMTLTETLKNGGTTEGTPFLVIPNDYGSKTLTVNATWDDWSNPVTLDVSADVTFNWEPGNIYTYNLTLEKYALKVDTEKFTEQW